MRTAFRSASIFTGFVLIAGFVNCSAPSFTALESPGFESNTGLIDDGGGTPSVPEPVPEGYSVADSTGKIPAFQDLIFKFKIPGASTGATYQSSNLPSWASIDAVNGEITGTPTAITDYSSITVTVFKGSSSSTVGPYKISVAGDPLKFQQWHLTNTGQTGFAALSGTAGNDIHLVETIKNRILGSGIRVAVSDSGVVETHRGLAPNLISGASRDYRVNYNTTHSWLGSATPALTDAGDAHGTAVAGLIAERGWLGLGGRGVAPFAKWAGFLFIQAQTNLSNTGYYDVGLQDQFAGDFDVFNYSWGDYQCALWEYDNTYKNKIKAGTSLRGGKGAIYLKAGGNEFYGYMEDCYENATSTEYYFGNGNFSEESTTPYIINVGAIDADGISASYSSPGSNLWISSPGGEFGWTAAVTSGNEYRQKPALVTTDFPGCSVGLKSESAAKSTFDAGQGLNTNCEHTNTMNGTSGATPVAAGAVALILSANPNLTWRDVRHVLAATADKVDPTRGDSAHPMGASSSYSLSGHTYEQGWRNNAAGYHFHNWYGFGRVNVDAAVAMAKTYTSGWGPFLETNSGTTWKYDSSTLNVSVPAANATGVSRTLAVTENRFIEGVQVRVSATNCIGNLGIEVTSPSGTKSIVQNINSLLKDTAITSHVYLTNAFYGERSNGTWTMKLVGGKSGCTTTWNNWQLNVLGHD